MKGIVIGIAFLLGVSYLATSDWADAAVTEMTKPAPTSAAERDYTVCKLQLDLADPFVTRGKVLAVCGSAPK
jgi:hypothetical protein